MYMQRKIGNSMVEHGKTYTLDDLHVLSSEGAFRPSGAVADAMAAMAGASAAGIEIPSLMALADFYGCGHLDVYDALRLLKGRGYDYRLRGIDSPIAVWRV